MENPDEAYQAAIMALTAARERLMDMEKVVSSARTAIEVIVKHTPLLAEYSTTRERERPAFDAAGWPDAAAINKAVEDCSARTIEVGKAWDKLGVAKQAMYKRPT